MLTRDGVPEGAASAPGVTVGVAVSLTPCSASAAAGVLERRGFALESAAARMCREAGGRVMTNVLVRELDLSQIDNRLDGRRSEVVADGLEAVGGAQLAMTPRSCVHCARMELPGHVLLASEAWHCGQLEPAKSVPAQSWWVKGDGPDSWSSQRKSVDDGQMRQLVLSVPLRGPRRSPSLSASEGLRRERGAGDGGGFARALRQRLSRCRCCRSPVSAGGEAPSAHDVMRNSLFEW